MYLSQEKSMGRSKVNISCNREVINACIVRHNHTFSYAIKFLIIRKGELISNVILVSLKNENQSGERSKPYSYTFHIGRCIGDASNNSTCSQISRAFVNEEIQLWLKWGQNDIIQSKGVKPEQILQYNQNFALPHLHDQQHDSCFSKYAWEVCFHLIQ